MAASKKNRVDGMEKQKGERWDPSHALHVDHLTKTSHKKRAQRQNGAMRCEKRDKVRRLENHKETSELIWRGNLEYVKTKEKRSAKRGRKGFIGRSERR